MLLPSRGNSPSAQLSSSLVDSFVAIEPARVATELARVAPNWLAVTQSTLLRLAMCVMVGGCSSHRDITIDGPYHLIEGEDDEQMSVCYVVPEGCIGRIPATVYAVGADASYVVAARHPQANRAITEFYYVIRSSDTPTVDTSAAVRGPFDAQGFEAARIELHLPALTYELPRLK